MNLGANLLLPRLKPMVLFGQSGLGTSREKQMVPACQGSILARDKSPMPGSPKLRALNYSDVPLNTSILGVLGKSVCRIPAFADSCPRECVFAVRLLAPGSLRLFSRRPWSLGAADAKIPLERAGAIKRQAWTQSYNPVATILLCPSETVPCPECFG